MVCDRCRYSYTIALLHEALREREARGDSPNRPPFFGPFQAHAIALHHSLDKLGDDGLRIVRNATKYH